MRSNLIIVLQLAALALSTEAMAATPNNAPQAQTPESQAPLAEPRRPLSELAGDAVITAKVKAALLAEASIGPLQIGVDTREGEVTLKGEADSQDQIDAALRIARGIDGVKKVENEMTIKK